EDRFAQGGGVTRGQVAVAVRGTAWRAGGGTGGLFGGLALAPGVGDLVELALGLLGLAAHPLLLGAQLLQLLFPLLAGQAALLLGFFLRLALGEFDLLLAPALLLLALGGELGFRVGAGLVLVDHVRLRDPFLRPWLRLDRRVLGHRFGQRLRRRHGLLLHRFGLRRGRRQRLRLLRERLPGGRRQR